MQKLKICVISTTILPCLSQKEGGYGGLEYVAWTHADGLAKRGHEVLLIAPIGSVAPEGVELHGTTLREGEQQAYFGYKDRLKNYDIILDHSWNKFSVMSKINNEIKNSPLIWLHAPANTMFNDPPPLAFPNIVAISKDMQAQVHEIWGVNSRVCYHGIDFDFYKPTLSNKRNDRWLFLARFSKIKGAHIAVDLARQLRFGLDLVGDDKITGEPEYVQRIMAQSTHNIKYVGPQTRQQCVEWFSNSHAMLHMNKLFREPFGLAPLEAQACGLPVIAFDNGAMRETIKNGKTGFIVKHEDEVKDLIKTNAISSIYRTDCIEWAKQFSIEKSIDKVEELITEVLSTGGW